jgi:hypothetical protein
MARNPAPPAPLPDDDPEAAPRHDIDAEGPEAGEARGINLVDIFATRAHDYDRLHALVAEGIARASSPWSVAYNALPGSLCEIDLQGGTFVLDRPLRIERCQLITLRNGTLVAGPDFPPGEYLISAHKVTALSFVSLFLECAKRASGICLEDFFRIRIEDCHIIHQRDYGIYSAPRGNNHELEVVKCHVSEFLYWDGYPKKKSSHGIIPAFDVDENRVSTGIFLGQADNVVADCNINLCRVGIHCGMRANRIVGNHITGGGSRDLDIFKGIEANNFGKSSAIINHNYIDNCTLWINCDDHDRLNARNYFHVTDNLFYRGYNHPRDGRLWSHIVINALKPGSKLGNVHICDNLFYNQDENLEGIKPRILYPLRVHTPVDPQTGVEGSLDHQGVTNFRMESNQFTNRFPTFEQPMGTTATKTVPVRAGKAEYFVGFREEIPVGVLAHASAELCALASGAPRPPIVRKLHPHGVTIALPDPFDGEIRVTATTRTHSSSKFPYTVA